jgi:hypothetical protein
LQQAQRFCRVTSRGADCCLRQGEILSNLIQLQLIVQTLGNQPRVEPLLHPYALVLTQDCDLEQDFNARQRQVAADKLIPSVLFCEVVTAEELFGLIRQTNKKLWDRIRINKDEHYHFLQQAEPACDTLQQGLPELALDFKRYFTIPTEEVYKRIEIREAQRRTLLIRGCPEIKLRLLRTLSLFDTQ